MANSKRIDITDEYKNSGVDITYVKSRGVLEIGGWYDGFVGIESHTLTLREFFDQLGIDQKAIQKAFR